MPDGRERRSAKRRWRNDRIVRDVGGTAIVQQRTRTQDHAPARRTPSAIRLVGRALLFTTVTVLALTAISGGLLAYAIYREARVDETAPADAIVVLGAAQLNGRPSATLRARLDHALQLYQAGYAPRVMLTGGMADGDRFSEAEVGHDYLLNRGVPASALLTAGGTTSWESMQQASATLNAQGARRVLLVSDPFHMFRVKQMATDLGLEPRASPTQTSPIRIGSPLEYWYMVRELFAYLAYLFTK